jgi:hypothetical protein
VEGIDTIAFANGFGDGGFPSIAGYDAQGNRVAIALWTIVAPWRLAFPVGEPPGPGDRTREGARSLPRRASQDQPSRLPGRSLIRRE